MVVGGVWPGVWVFGGLSFSPTVTAVENSLTTRPRTTRLRSIWTVTRLRARSVSAVMSPNPTVENTVTVKYMAPTLFIGWVKSAWFTPTT